MDALSWSLCLIGISVEGIGEPADEALLDLIEIVLIEAREVGRHALTIFETHSGIIAKEITDIFLVRVRARIVGGLHPVIVLLVVDEGVAPVSGVLNLGSGVMEASCALVVNLQLLSVHGAHFRIVLFLSFKLQK